MNTVVDLTIRVADECWIALSLLTKVHPERQSFTASEIAKQVQSEGAHPDVRPGVLPHIHLHNVANPPPNPARYRMFHKLADGTYRLHRPTDWYHPQRTGKTHPKRVELPVKYHALLDWYETEYCAAATGDRDLFDPLLALRGVGREVWAGVDPDSYVEGLRAGWESEPASKP